MLNNRNIKIAYLNISFNYKNLESFFVIRVINNIIYELKLLNKIIFFYIFFL